jgi:hypothetical protein
MRKMKMIFQVGLALIGLSGAAGKLSAQTISPHFFGQNAWMPDTIGNQVYNGKLHQSWQKVRESKATLIRYGGTSVDKHMPTDYQYIRIIDSVRANGMEPMIEVPFNDHMYTAQQAAAIVNYINVVKGKNIKYWVIANEPNLGYSYTSSSQVAAYIRPFATAMKNVDPTIKIVGPELAWFDQGIITGLTTPNGPDDITGADQNGHYYIDYFTFHTYPFNGSQTRQQVVSKLAQPNGLQDNLTYLNTRIAASNTAHNRGGNNAIKVGITEANISWQNTPNDDVYGAGNNGFLCGQFVCEMMGMAMKNSVDMFNVWSVVEGSTTTNIGYLNPSNGMRKPLFYHFQMMAENFAGTYANCTTNQANVKAYGCKNGQNIVVMVMNEELSTNYNFTLRFNTATVTGSNPLKINVNAGVANEFNASIAPQTTVVYIFNGAGTIIRKGEYSLNNHAVSDLPPTWTDYTTTGVTENTSTDEGPFELRNVYPNPCPGKLFVELHKGATLEKEFEVQLVNAIGQIAFSKKYQFINGKEEIQLSPDLATGVYILRVKEGEKDNYLVKKILVEQ